MPILQRAGCGFQARMTGGANAVAPRLHPAEPGTIASHAACASAARVFDAMDSQQQLQLAAEVEPAAHHPSSNGSKQVAESGNSPAGAALCVLPERELPVASTEPVLREAQGHQQRNRSGSSVSGPAAAAAAAAAAAVAAAAAAAAAVVVVVAVVAVVAVAPGPSRAAGRALCGDGRSFPEAVPEWPQGPTSAASPEPRSLACRAFRWPASLQPCYIKIISEKCRSP